MKLFIFILLMLTLLVFIPAKTLAQNISTRLKGKILLQVEEKGEAWYINPSDERRYFLGRPVDAFNLMRQLGVGIKNADLQKFEIALFNFGGFDSDGDGLPDAFEDAIGTDKNRIDSDEDGFNDKEELKNGYNPLGSGKLSYDYSFASKHKGKIFLQVENKGEAWYINPSDERRYFLGRPTDAFNIMRNLGLGINNKDLKQIPEYGEDAAQAPGPLEKETSKSTDIFEDPSFLNDAEKIIEKDIDWSSLSQEQMLNSPLLDLPESLLILNIIRGNYNYKLKKTENLTNKKYIIVDANGFEIDFDKKIEISPNEAYLNNYWIIPADDARAVRGYNIVNVENFEGIRKLETEEEIAAAKQESKDINYYSSKKFLAAFLINDESLKSVINKINIGDTIMVTGMHFKHYSVEYNGLPKRLEHCLKNTDILYLNKLKIIQ